MCLFKLQTMSSSIAFVFKCRLAAGPIDAVQKNEIYKWMLYYSMRFNSLLKPYLVNYTLYVIKIL
jgi:hypothetical protein